MYCVIKCVKTKRVLKGNFASSVFHICNAKTQICVTGPQCVKTDCEETDCKGLDWIRLDLDAEQSKTLHLFVHRQPLKRILLHVVSSLRQKGEAFSCQVMKTDRGEWNVWVQF
jgi:hypothetical protein